jgi:hypothetical protein
MFILKNNELQVEIIDPKKDSKLLGSRYCTGGYIFQVKDLEKGNLFSGPQYPNPHFDVFHGQGAPEVFTGALNQEDVETNEDAYVIGVGRVIRTSEKKPFHVVDNPNVREFCKWEINENARSENCLEMRSICRFNRWNFIINKRVTLNHRNVVSITKICNTCKENIPIRWFAHPFFPIPNNSIVCKFSFQFDLNENGGYFINKAGFIEMRPENNWKKGLYQKILFNQKENLSVIQNHPLLGKIAIHCDYVPESIAIWANDLTFSFEPFYENIIKGGCEQSWSIKYCF